MSIILHASGTILNSQLYQIFDIINLGIYNIMRKLTSKNLKKIVSFWVRSTVLNFWSKTIFIVDFYSRSFYWNWLKISCRTQKDVGIFFNLLYSIFFIGNFARVPTLPLKNVFSVFCMRKYIERVMNAFKDISMTVINIHSHERSTGTSF